MPCGTQGLPVSAPMLDCVVAACSQMGDIARAFESFEAYAALGLAPGAQAFNAVLSGCIAQGVTQPVPKAGPCPSLPPEPFPGGAAALPLWDEQEEVCSMHLVGLLMWSVVICPMIEQLLRAAVPAVLS